MDTQLHSLGETMTSVVKSDDHRMLDAKKDTGINERMTTHLHCIGESLGETMTDSLKSHNHRKSDRHKVIEINEKLTTHLHHTGETTSDVVQSGDPLKSDGQKDTETNERVTSDLCHFEDTMRDVVKPDGCRWLVKPREPEIDELRTTYLHPLGESLLEQVKPYASRKSRVSHLYFKDKETTDAWLKGARHSEVTTRNIMYELPKKKIPVTRHDNSFMVGSVKVKGLTKQLSGTFKDLYVKPWSNKGYVRGGKSKQVMQHLGVKVDKQLKLFASGDLEFGKITEYETRKIIHHLARKSISLVDSGVLVSNYQRGGEQKCYTGTEIDLVGYDHVQRKLVIIEVKVTGKTIEGLCVRHKQSPLLKPSCFRKSEMSRYATQLACTTLMYRNTYMSSPHYPLLVVCEKGSVHCKSYDINPDQIDSSKFYMIEGYTTKRPKQ